MSLANNILSILWVASTVWVIYDIFTNNQKLKYSLKVLWTILAIVFGLFTAIVYIFIYKMKK
jgi:hypothetical protein